MQSKCHPHESQAKNRKIGGLTPVSVHSWLTESMKSSQTQLQGNPYAGLAENLITLIVNAFQVKPGWGLYALLVPLGIAAALGFTRVLSRLRVAPMSSS
jgi:hypothetical protein